MVIELQRNLRKNRITIVVASIVLFFVLSTLFVLITNKSNLFSHGLNSKAYYDLTRERQDNYDKMLISYGTIQERKTGTESFNTPSGKSVDDGSLVSDMDGNDVSMFDNYVRTHDTITYVLELGINRNPATTEPGEDLKGGVIKVKVTLPPDENGKHNLFLGKDAWMKDARYNSDKSELTCYYEIPSEKRAAGGIQELTFTVYSGGNKKELSPDYTPKFEVWMEGNKNDNPDSTAESVLIEDEELKITGLPRARETVSVSSTTTPGELNGVKGYYVKFAAQVSAYTSTKGVLFPEAPIKSTLEIDYKYHQLGTNTGYISLPTDDPTVPDSINGTSLVAYGRPCEATPGFYPTETSNTGYTCASGRSNYSDGRFYSWDSGTFTASQNGNQISFVTTGNTYDGYIGSSYVISNGFQIFVPEYKPDPNADYEYQITIKTVNLSYIDQTGEEVTVTTPISSQAVTLRDPAYQPNATGNYSLSVTAYSSGTVYNSNDIAVFPAGTRLKLYADVSSSEGNYKGGLERLCKLDTTNVKLSPYSSTTDIYTTYTTKTGYTSPTQANVVKKIGVLKANPEVGLRTDEQINNATYDDFDWYSSIAEAQEHGEPTAFYTNEPDYEGVVSSYLDFYIEGRVAADVIGYNGMVKCQTNLYADEERTIVYKKGYDQDYFKGYYNEEEGRIRGGTPTSIGHTYQLGFYKLGITNKFTQLFNGSEKTNYNVQGEEIDFQITPTITVGATPNDTITSTFRVVAKIPSEIYYKENSSNIEPNSVVKNSDGTTSVTWIFEDWDITVPLPVINYSATISAYATNNASKTFYSYIYDDVNKFVSSVYVTKGMTITNLAGASLRKEMNRGFVDREGGFEITDHIYNISQTQLKNIKTFEILPNNNDDKGSSFSGSFTHTLLELSEGQKFYYTTVNPDSIEFTIDELGNKSIKNIDLENDNRFIEVSVGDTIPSNATMTASFIPSISSMDDVEFKYSVHFTGNNGGDKYVYVLNASSTTLESAINTEAIEITVAERIISGKAFEDVNRNDIYDTDTDNLLQNINVQLIKVTPGGDGQPDVETPIETKQTNADGEYSFSLNLPGKYIVKFTNKNGYEIVQKGNINVPETSKVNENGKTDLINHEDNPFQAVMEKGNFNFGIRKKAATLTTKYLIFGTNTNLFDPVSTTVYYTDNYATSPPSQTIPEKYVFHSNDGDPVSGVVNKDNIEVIYYYTYRDATLTVKYVDQDENDIDPTQNIINQGMHWDDTYTTEQKTFTNYSFVERTGDPASGTIAQDHVEVVYHYALKPATLTIKYVDQDGEDIDPTQNIINAQKHWGDQYSSTQKTFTNYNFVERTGDPASGTIAQDHVEVVYHYALKPATLTIKYVDQYGEDIDSTQNTINAPKHWGDQYSSTQKTFTNYNFVGRTGDPASGTIAKDHIEVIYHYQVKSADVTANYVDEDGNNIISPITVESFWGNSYSTEQKTFTNYSFVKVADGSDPVSGTVGKDHVVVTYIYHLKEATLTIKYVDQDGNDIDPSKNTINAPKHWGDTYSSEQLEFTNYTFDHRSGAAPSGTIAADHVEVVYHYNIKPATLTIKYVDQDGNDIDSSKNIINAQKHWGDSYTSTQLEFTNYTFDHRSGAAPSGTIAADHVEVVYHYNIKPATLTIKYVDQDGANIDPSKNTINAPKFWGDEYTSTQLTFTNYTFDKRTGDAASGIIAKDHVEVIYHYNIKPATLTIKYVDQDGNDIDPSKNTIDAPKFWGDEYTSTQLEFTNYTFDKRTGDAASGIIAKDHVEVIYHYVIKEATITIKYVDQDGNDIDSSKNTINAPKHWGDSYTSEQLTFTNYTFDKRTGDPASGIIAKDHVEVIYHYNIKPATLTIKYVDQDGNDIDSSKNTINAPKFWGDTYSSEQLEFTNYTFDRRTGDPASGTIAKDHVEVVYHYNIKPATLTIKYVDQDGNDIDPTKNTINAPKHWGDTYSSEQLEFTNYTFDRRTGDPASGTIAQDHVEVVYHYNIKPATLTIRYVDEDDHDIDPTKNTINAQKHWGDTYSSEQLEFTNYSFVSQTGDPASGTIAKDHVEVKYIYHLRDSVLTVRYVDEDNHDIQPIFTKATHWGEEYTSEQKTIPNYSFVGMSNDSDPASGTVSKNNINVTYVYHLKEATLTIKYVDESGNNIDSSKNRSEDVHWGDEYTSEQYTFPNYDFVERRGDAASGIIEKDSVSVTYVYTLKPSVITVHHYIEGTTDKLAPDETINKKYTQNYSTSQINTTDLDYEFASQTGDAPSGVVNKDSYEIIYNYKLKKGTVYTHHLLYNGEETTTELAPTVSHTYNYTETYTTEISPDVAPNYELYRKTDNYTDVLRSPRVDVYYYYQLKDSQLSTTIEKTGTDKITSKQDKVSYNIKFNAEVKDYIGDATITIVDKLPYSIDEEKSSLAGGIYNSEEKTITWQETWTGINSFNEENETAKKEIVRDISLVFTDINSRERIMVNTARASIVLINNERSVENQKETIINIPGKITVKYIDENEKVLEEKENEDLVGEPLVTEAIEIEGYNLVEKPETEEYTFEDDPQTVIYKYERIRFNIKTIVRGEGGEITGNELVPWGENSTKDNIVIRAKKGYAIDKVIVDGKEIRVTAKDEMIVDFFKDVKEDHLVEVTFIVYNPNTSAKYIIAAIVLSVITSLVVLVYGKRKLIFTTKKVIS